MGELKGRLGRLADLEHRIADLAELAELGDDDPSFFETIAADANAAAAELDALELELTLNGPYDGKNAIMVIHSGEGGVDAQDWAEMISRMYLKWADLRGFQSELLDTTQGDEAGIKNATVEIRGKNAYGYVRGEAGSHRLVRLSPFDSAHRRHTAFALVEVLPGNRFERRDRSQG